MPEKRFLWETCSSLVDVLGAYLLSSSILQPFNGAREVVNYGFLDMLSDERILEGPALGQ